MIINKFRRNSDVIILLKKYFKISDIEKIVICEGIKILTLLSRLDRIKDENLDLFIKKGYLKKLIKKNNKEEYILKFLNRKIKRASSFNNIFFRNKSLKRGGKPNVNKSINIIKKKKYRKKIWITVGIDNYKNWNKLNNANSDINKISNFFSDKNFKMIKISDYKATKSNIEKIFLNRLYNELYPDDLIVFSFHGHGTVLNINNKDHGFIVPYDAPNHEDLTPFDLISIHDITNWVNYIKANHVLILLDCCFSGFATLRSSNYKLNNKYSDRIISKILSQKNKIVITSGNSKQEVSDGGWGNNSIFTGSLLSFPGFQNGLGSVLELYSYLLANLGKYSNQTPCLGKLIGDEGGDIFLDL